MPLSFSRAVDRAVARENANPQGLPQEDFAAMAADILANPERYPVLHAALTASMPSPAAIATVCEKIARGL